ncbi:deoxyguanosinetriphosphate triphosphohydrolase family protein [Leucobacter denitrificans]|uniref:DNTP triphosphohydrolase n=1 Tax=Leucobacter denitrificans TaxID=683042 RepID=A0A7G9S1Y5_9MICO|nr:dNTP triphosphohydrolase [Leucobacter denitrificans]QNN61860.1 dNTP triphosphohydrolase [Leucobacter denitrificans]
MTERTTRAHAEFESSQHAALNVDGGSLDANDVEASGSAADEFRIDLERIRFSSYFARLSDVTQVVPQSGVGPVMHNRLTHSLKVSAVARVIAANLAGAEARHRAFVRGEAREDDATGAIVAKLGGCDTVIAQSAAHAHDLGHPPFGHLGERVLDRVAREKLGLPEGFEGNAQSFRILVQLDTLGRDFPGLNLTAATRAATLKYPWTRAKWIGVSADDIPVSERPRGVGLDPATGAEKFSVYALDKASMDQALAAFPGIGEGRQTVECAVMDLADDIAYAVHDLDDFARAGVLQQAAVAAEFRTWLAGSREFADEATPSLEMRRRNPGASLELLWRRLHMKDDWIADRDAFIVAVQRVSDDLGESLLATPYDGGIDSERAMSGFTRRWIEHLRTSIVVEERPHIRSGHVRLDRQAWHEVMVLKFVHAHFVLERPELALPQRGMAKVITDLALGFDDWLSDPEDAPRAPRRIIEWAEEVTEESFRARGEHPELLLGDTSDAALRRQGRSRAILDYVSSLSDQQAIATHQTFIGA